MSRVEALRKLVEESVAGILALLEAVAAEHENEISRLKEENARQQKLLDVALKPRVLLQRAVVTAEREDAISCRKEENTRQQKPLDITLDKPHRTDTTPQFMCKAKCSTSIDHQADQNIQTRPPHIKQEQVVADTTPHFMCKDNCSTSVAQQADHLSDQEADLLSDQEVQASPPHIKQEQVVADTALAMCSTSVAQEVVQKVDHQDVQASPPHIKQEQEQVVAGTPMTISPYQDALHHVVSRTDKTSQLAVKHSAQGPGLVASGPFLQGDFVVEVRGEALAATEGQRRRAVYPESCGTSILDFTWRGQAMCMDAVREASSLGRLVVAEPLWPSCRLEVFEVGGAPHLCLFALRSIGAGDNITYAWRSQVEGSQEALASPHKVEGSQEALASPHKVEESQEALASPHKVEGAVVPPFFKVEDSGDTEDSGDSDDSDVSGDSLIFLSASGPLLPPTPSPGPLGAPFSSPGEGMQPQQKSWCSLCSRPFLRLGRHLERHHPQAEEVAAALLFPRGSRERRVRLERLCRQGDRQHSGDELSARFRGVLGPARFCRPSPASPSRVGWQLWHSLRGTSCHGDNNNAVVSDQLGVLGRLLGGVRGGAEAAPLLPGEAAAPAAPPPEEEDQEGAPTLLGFTQDLQTLHCFLEVRQRDLMAALCARPGVEVWQNLAETCLAHTYLLNLRRRGAVSRLAPAATLCPSPCAGGEELRWALSPAERLLSSQLPAAVHREMGGARPLPVLLGGSAQRALALLAATRVSCGVADGYAFARPGSWPAAALDGPGVVVRAAEACGAGRAALALAGLQRQAERPWLLLSLGPGGRGQLARLLGHAPQQYDSLASDAAWLARLSVSLAAAEQGLPPEDVDVDLHDIDPAHSSHMCLSEGEEPIPEVEKLRPETTPP